MVDNTFQPPLEETHIHVISLLRNQLFYLHRAGLLRHSMVVTADER